MEGLNRSCILGNLGEDPELRRTQSDTAVLNVRVATNERYKDSEGEWKDRTEWHSVVIWGKRGEALSEILHKGDPIYVEGPLRTRSWEGDDGKKNYKTEIHADHVVLLGAKKDTRNHGDRDRDTGRNDRDRGRDRREQDRDRRDDRRDRQDNGRDDRDRDRSRDGKREQDFER